MSYSIPRVNVLDGIAIFKHLHVFEQCLVIVFLSHKINPKSFLSNFWGSHQNKAAFFSTYQLKEFPRSQKFVHKFVLLLLLYLCPKHS